MVERLNPGSWETALIEATSELLRRGWEPDVIVNLVWDVVDAENVFQDEPEPA
jgi:hypothetical protein